MKNIMAINYRENTVITNLKLEWRFNLNIFLILWYFKYNTITRQGIKQDRKTNKII